ncbi:MAG TPA: DUF177 domain-containing protein [Longimicrobiaceae bacterium]|nr:DUF177 domain-containing protein [Longimicrobiaceae bacterium]
MLNLNSRDLARGELRVQGEIAPDDPIWEGVELSAREPFAVDLMAREVGGGVLVQGALKGKLQLECRRCLSAVEWTLDEAVSLWFEPLASAEDADGEVYPLPEQGEELDLAEPLREQILLRVPHYVLCKEECRGLCAHCGADLNQGDCGCGEEPTAGPWDALKSIKFD